MNENGTDAVSAPLRAGFIGGGFMAAVHGRAVRTAGVIPAGVASSTLESAGRAAARLGLGHAYSSVEQLLDDDSIDVVHICTPNVTHAEFAAAALQAGKHVVCEKPLATSVEDAAAVTALARTLGRTAAVPFVYRFHPMVREARARVRHGQVGRVLTIQGSFLQDWLLSSEDDDWRVDESLGGPSRAFADIGSHLCDVIEFILNDRISRLAALTRTAFSQRGGRDVRTEDIVSVVFETRGGAVGTLLISQVAPGRKNRLALEISGTTETLTFDQEQPETLWVGRRSGSQLLVRDPAVLDPSAARYCSLPAGHPQGYQDAFNSFISDVYLAVRSGTAPDGLPLFEDGLRASRLTSAVQRSAREGGWQDVPPNYPEPTGHKTPLLTLKERQ
ncbi:Gfo/Idh/MocA family oxidoreductase [Arthrobacter sp. PAMC25564]|uniref:Gfo/Idh/MocA family protein n=1 Tax=Arthrobacter sp. PAMC25564 TaxID=2565366 RepID=UPI0010A221AC|nr:Gfo/Idh/MocA family oxidoreductase [Arthrobacter sp. PAMC25564]QCB97609.1 Gfo/Idh/MocA family oxidoreductase [Arthrobacter sp. PAMC25564]